MTSAQNIHYSRYVPRHSTWNGTNYASLETVAVRSLQRPASVNNPIRADGTRAPSSWICFSHTTRPWVGGGTFHHRMFPEITGKTSGLAVNNTPTDVGDVSDCVNFLENNRLKAMAQATESSKNLSAFAAQANSTGKMVGKAASQFAHGLDNLMRGPGGLAQKFGRMAQWKTLPARYLEYCFGWAPLAGDIENAFERLSELSLNGYGVRMSLRCRKPAPLQTLIRQDGVAYACLPAGANTGVTLYGVREAFCPVSYVYQLPQWLVDNVPTISPFSTAWELAPYSFVLDLFVPIGDWFGALELAQFSPHFTEGSETVFVRDTYTRAELVPGHDYVADSWSAEGRTVVTAMWRNAISEAPTVSMPHFKPLPGVQQAAQGLSLLTQVFQRWR